MFLMISTHKGASLLCDAGNAKRQNGKAAAALVPAMSAHDFYGYNQSHGSKVMSKIPSKCDPARNLKGRHFLK
ncbi:hypothetical protein BL250_10925 [Erwinia sp. OLTSP20]|nr:hypothetical protein BV501_10595 [Erwinia sp. OAMSP11]PIJ71394.1 hypothetical protein BK416_11800 [Erwinia sp. OLSSP12]PIJ80628.1 hypothetical protein BLD47_10695 [Erwinia sp. OLCASP19]PIJ82775.1 hypothetical protein BLD46_10375 [Erwinia sp. OLMTSP26]PIJ85461.1 hypothetical protein BLD49_10565 [Erwinia sp. OLMDSP33]PIJ92227.1 hypothetical protein BL250_10925 [Erwinia sp. OLTSP20]PIJ93291.1 hypothetical protein BL249_04880 [Erwinia sp. OLFS4]